MVDIHIFPKNGFKYIWSDIVEDFLASGASVNELDVVEMGYKDYDLNSAIRSYHEIIIKCDGYYTINYNDEELVHKFIIEGYN